uniref:Helicase C-terminal domain-containing protein n=1 Tax=Salix viminalis TaxID=40686 RepID=A0A6N2LUF3_SALVM
MERNTAIVFKVKNCKGVEIEKIPFSTLNIIQRLSKSFDAGRWEPCRPEHFTDEKVDEFIRMLPRKLLDALLPFQLDGLRFGLRRGGRCLIADEMGLGKTLQEFVCEKGVGFVRIDGNTLASDRQNAEFVCEKGVGFVRIDGNTLASDRQNAVSSFQSSDKVKIAIISITAGGVGLDFSSAQNVVFLELPQSPSLMLQAEDRAHRRGQSNAVNIYIFCAKDTLDETRWQNLNKSLHRVSSTMDGKYDAVPEILVERISYFGKSDKGIRGSSEVQVELPDSGSVWNSQPFKTHNEENVMLIGSTFHTDDLNLG